MISTLTQTLCMSESISTVTPSCSATVFTDQLAEEGKFRSLIQVEATVSHCKHKWTAGEGPEFPEKKKQSGLFKF